jgi:hypothetical protein
MQPDLSILWDVSGDVTFSYEDSLAATITVEGLSPTSLAALPDFYLWLTPSVAMEMIWIPIHA